MSQSPKEVSDPFAHAELDEAPHEFETSDLDAAAHLTALGYTPTLQFRFCGDNLDLDLAELHAHGFDRVDRERYDKIRAQLGDVIDAIEEANDE